MSIRIIQSIQGIFDHKLGYFVVATVMAFFVSACEQAQEHKEIPPRTVLTLKLDTNSQPVDKLYAGKLRASTRATLSFEASGNISELAVELGDSFEQGDKLAQLDDTKLKITLKSKQAELRNALANLKDAQLEYQRKVVVKESGAISDLSLDQAETRLEGAKAQHEAAVASAESVQKQIRDMSLVAPFSGEVVARFAEPSQVVNAGQAILEVVGQLQSMEGVVHVPVNTRQTLKLGDSVDLRALPSSTSFKASITEIGNQANEAGLFPITISPDAPLVGVIAGQSIEVSLHHDNSDIIYIPVTAYGISASGETYVFSIADNQLVRKTIAIGAVTRQGVEVLSGLAIGDEIVVKGVDLLSDGEVVVAVSDSTKRFGN